MRYIAEDGKVFNSEHECLKHENDIKAKKEKEEREKKAKEEKIKKIEDQIKELQTKITELQKERIKLCGANPSDQVSKNIIIDPLNVSWPYYDNRFLDELKIHFLGE